MKIMVGAPAILSSTWLGSMLPGRRGDARRTFYLSIRDVVRIQCPHLHKALLIVSGQSHCFINAHCASALTVWSHVAPGRMGSFLCSRKKRDRAFDFCNSYVLWYHTNHLCLLKKVNFPKFIMKKMKIAWNLIILNEWLFTYIVYAHKYGYT